MSRQHFETCGCSYCKSWRRLRAENPRETEPQLRIRVIKAGKRPYAPAKTQRTH